MRSLYTTGLKIPMAIFGLGLCGSFLILCTSCFPLFDNGDNGYSGTGGAALPPPRNTVASTISKPRLLTGGELVALENDVYQDINSARQNHGLPALTYNTSAVEVARQHSADMADGNVSFGHDGFNQRVHWLTQDAFPSAKHFGENVFDIPSNYSSNLAQSITDAWLQSPHHYKNIMGDYTTTGMGASQSSDGSIYITQFFVKEQ